MTMDPEEIAEYADKYRHTDIGLANYKQVLNDAFVMMRELAHAVIDLKERVDKLEPNAKLEGGDAGGSKSV